MATEWIRGWGKADSWATGNQLIASISPGDTLARVHFGWRATGVTSNEQESQALAEDFMAVGIVTQTSAHGSTPPNALTNANDANPPLERWLWWATTAMRPAIMGSLTPDIMCWSTDITTVIDDTKGMVKANVPAGQTLGLYLTWAPWTTAGWQVRGDVAMNWWFSALFLV